MVTTPASPPPAEEDARVAALERYGILDTPAEPAFDDLARLASLVCGAPFARISFIDAGRQWCKAMTGTLPAELPRRAGFCARTILQAAPLIVRDAAGDPRFMEAATAYGEPAPRFYAGVPLRTEDGHAIGTLCVLDLQPRDLAAGSAAALTIIADMAMAHLEQRIRQPARAAALREREQRFRRLAGVANEGIAIVRGGRIVEANNAFAQLFGGDMREIIGRALLDFVAPTSRETAGSLVATASDKPWETEGQRGDGSTFHMEVAIKAIPYGSTTALGCVVRDVTERKEIDRLKNEFVSIVSHELRTPLTSLRGSLGLMEEGAVGALPPKAQDLVRIARQNTDRLIRLINDILDLEKIEAGKVQLRIAALDPVELVESSIAELHTMAQQYKVKLTSVVSHHEPVAGDRDRVIQVLTNLLSNAIKFSPEHGTVAVSSADGTQGFLRITVRDEGQGIPPDRQARLFTRFEQLEEASSRRRGGTGLGLAISRSLVEQQGGRIGVDSAPGQGSAFWFELPLVPGGRTTGGFSQVPGKVAVLVVEDDPAVARVLGAILGRHGHEVLIAGTLAQARRALERSHPSVILLDMHLPDGSGLDMADHLAGTGRLADVPIVVLSGAGPEADHRNARVSEWLTKPFSERELVRAVRAAMAGEGERPRGESS